MVVRFHQPIMYKIAPRTVLDVERGIDELFDEFFRPIGESQEFVPAFDLAEQEHESILVAELPGVKREDIRITVHEGILNLSAERKGVSLPEDARWLRNEIPSGRVARSIALPHAVETDRITAELKDGILRVVLPKAASARPKEIAIQ